MNAIKNSMFEITKKTLSCCPMNLSRFMHELGELVHSIGNIWPSEGQILEVAKNFMICCVIK